MNTMTQKVCGIASFFTSVLLFACTTRPRSSLLVDSGDVALGHLRNRSELEADLLAGKTGSQSQVSLWQVVHARLLVGGNVIDLYGLKDPKVGTSEIVKVHYPILFLNGTLWRDFDVPGIDKLGPSLWTRDLSYPVAILGSGNDPKVIWCQSPLRGHGPQAVAVQFGTRVRPLLTIEVNPNQPGYGLYADMYVEPDAGHSKLVLTLLDPATAVCAKLLLEDGKSFDKSKVPAHWIKE